MSSAVKDWSWLRIFAIFQGVVVMVYFLSGRMDADTSTFFLVAAIFIWLIGEKKEDPVLIRSTYHKMQDAGFEGVFVMPKEEESKPKS